MKTSKNHFGNVGNAEITRVTAENKNGISASFINYGATLTSLKMPDKNGNIEALTLGYDNLDSYVKDTNYFGCTVGRVANRIENGRFCIGDKTYQLALNENGTSHLHGGSAGFNKAVWALETMESDAFVCVSFSYTSQDGEEGYPGKLDVCVQYILDDANGLTINYHARSDAKTPINLTNHTYWNLNGAGKKNILAHRLHINADTYLEVDSKLIPTGKFIHVSGTPFDFKIDKMIGKQIIEAGTPGYDHCYVLNAEGDVDMLAAKVCDPESGRSMEIYTTKPGMQFYTGNFLEDKHGAFCLETQYYPNCINMPDCTDKILSPGEEYNHRTIHKFLLEK